MICRRAFFPGIFCILDSSIYVFGGQDGSEDLKMCEKYSVAENVWRPIQPMNEARNGSSCVILDKAIFVFGGNSQQKNSLDSVERYSIEYDCWERMRIRLKSPLQDSLAFNLGGYRVLILGGSNNNVANLRMDVYDLSAEC